MTRPRIGITSPFDWVTHANIEQYEVGRHSKLLESLGAEPVILPRGYATAHALQNNSLQGLLFSGGGDVDSSLYGGSPDRATDRVDATRDAGELALIREGFASRVPTLCVCRGMQLANTAFGGTLIEDIRKELGVGYTVAHHQVRDSCEEPDKATHEVHIDSRSAFGVLIGEDLIRANSIHHQAIRTLAPPFRAVALAADGITEAIELIAPEFFFLGIQWHPERLQNDKVSLTIYEAFITASKSRIKKILL